MPQLTLLEAWTASGDGTTYKGTNAVSHFVTFPPIPSANELEGKVQCVPRRRFLGTTREVNHKTSTQLENWIGLFEDIASVHRESPGGSEIGRKATGYSADHAADQMKLSRELCAYKQSCDYRSRGEEAIKSKSEEEIKKVLDEKFGDILVEVGGWKDLGSRSREDQEKLLERLINEVCVHFGKLAFAELPEWFQQIAGLWRWSGCCMHKDLNTFKGGAMQLRAFWKGAGLEGPVKLLNRKQEEQETITDATAMDCELSKASGGAAKLADLLGALVQNKEETQGHPDEFRTFSADQLGHEISFPDTSNTRYQCYGDAATELIRNPDLYINFVRQLGDKKKRGAGLNHMEKNILKGLMDPATRTELAVFSLYSEAISKPYAVTVRGSYNESKNALDLGPAHLKIITHIDTLIENLDLLVGDHASHETGALYGIHWDQAVVHHIHSIHHQLSHLRKALVAFLQGARAKWVSFTKEFAQESPISDSAEERLLSFRSPTNDHSEGAGAMWKLWSRRAPSMTTHQKNARLFIQLNSPDIETFFHDLPEPDHAYARRKAREMDAAKLPAKERKAQAKADREAADEGRREAERLRNHQEAREAEELRMVEGFQPILCLETFLAFPENKPSNGFLRRQLVWHRRIGGDETLPSGTFTGMKKSRMKELVVRALVNWTQGDVADVDMENSGEPETITTVKEDDRNCDSSTQLPVKFGCKWDPVDYSCAYDCIFTAFTWIYFHATSTWRERWRRESAAANFLSKHFENILVGLSGPAPDHAVPTLFAEGRDAWRDRLSEYNPTEFPRQGPKYASVTRILEVLADDRNPSHYATVDNFPY